METLLQECAPGTPIHEEGITKDASAGLHCALSSAVQMLSLVWPHEIKDRTSVLSVMTWRRNVQQLFCKLLKMQMFYSPPESHSCWGDKRVGHEWSVSQASTFQSIWKWENNRFFKNCNNNGNTFFAEAWNSSCYYSDVQALNSDLASRSTGYEDPPVNIMLHNTWKVGQVLLMSWETMHNHTLHSRPR